MAEREADGLRQTQPAAGGILYKIFNIAFAVLFIVVCLLAIFLNADGIHGYGWLWLLLWTALGVGLAFLLSRLFAMMRQLSRGTEVSVAILLFILLIGLQVLAMVDLWPVADGAGYGPVLQQASDNVIYGSRADGYFLEHPGDAGMYHLLRGYLGLLSLVGVVNFTLPVMALSALATDIAVLLMYFVARRVFGGRRALFLLVCSVLVAPFVLWLPFAAAEVVALPVPVGVVLLWLKVRAAWRGGRVRAAVLGFCGLSALAALGALVKPLVLVVWIAVALDLLLMLRGGGRWLVLLGGAVLAAAIFLLGGFLVRNNRAMPIQTQDAGMPKTVGVMMGLKGDGGYDAGDMAEVEALGTRQARAAYIDGEVNRRVADLGPLGMLRHLGQKLGHTFGDGTFGAAEGYAELPAGRSLLMGVAAPGSGGYGVLSAYTFGAAMAMLAWMAVAAAKSLYRDNNAISFVRVAVFGVTLVLMIWEGGARHLVSFIPLLMLGALEASPIPVPRVYRQRARQKLAVPEAAVPAPTPGNGPGPPAEEDLATPLAVTPAGGDGGGDGNEMRWQETYPEGWMPQEEQPPLPPKGAFGAQPPQAADAPGTGQWMMPAPDGPPPGMVPPMPQAIPPEQFYGAVGAFAPPEAVAPPESPVPPQQPGG